jgi:hypothetical protein
MLGQGSLFAFLGATRAALRATNRHREQRSERHAVERGEAEQRSDREVLLSGFGPAQVDDRNPEPLGSVLLRPAPLRPQRGKAAANGVESGGFGLRHASRVRSAESGKQELARCCFGGPSSRWRSLADHSAALTRQRGGVKMSGVSPFGSNSGLRGPIHLDAVLSRGRYVQ